MVAPGLFELCEIWNAFMVKNSDFFHSFTSLCGLPRHVTSLWDWTWSQDVFDDIPIYIHNERDSLYAKSLSPLCATQSGMAKSTVHSLVFLIQGCSQNFSNGVGRAVTLCQIPGYSLDCDVDLLPWRVTFTPGLPLCYALMIWIYQPWWFGVGLVIYPYG